MSAPSAPSCLQAGGRGASLLETLLAAGMLVLVVIPLFGMFEGASRIFARGDAASNLHQDLRASVDRIVRDLRMAGYDPSATGIAAAFELAGATTVRFLSDADLDGTTERIEYTYDAAARTVTREFWQWTGAAWGPPSGALVVARNVDSLTLTYFNAADGAPATPAEVRRVTITVTSSEAVAGYGLERYTVTSAARPRNLL